MVRGVRWYFVGSLLALTLAGCGRNYFAERDPWRREAEVACLKSGVVKEGPGRVRVQPIEGPGVCGADFPLKVAAIGATEALGFNNEPIRPPGAIPAAQMPRWPAAQPSYPAPAPEPYQAPLQTAPQAGAYDYQPQPRAPIASMPIAPPPTGPALPALGPMNAPRSMAQFTAVEIKPQATLACPIVSALDQWIASSVQPAAERWFRQPVVEIKQISAYSCRGMNGQRGAPISEHAFGNALDIAAFVLADGRRITVKDGWRGAPEEQGFLRDVQGAACETFTTVLAPGSNAFHYDHIHVDLMRRASGRSICEPGPVDGEQVAAQARRYSGVGGRRSDPVATGSVSRRGSSSGDWVEDPGPRPAIDWSTDRHRSR